MVEIVQKPTVILRAGVCRNMWEVFGMPTTTVFGQVSPSIIRLRKDRSVLVSEVNMYCGGTLCFRDRTESDRESVVVQVPKW